MKKILSTLLVGWIAFIVHAQRVPMQIGSLINYPVQEQWKGKPVILDLFNSNCATCFQMMPKVNDLQKKFEGRVQFVLVGDEDGRVQNLYARFEKRLGLQLEVIYDSNFFNYYRVDFVPRYVWIQPDGRVAAITNPASLTTENIDRFLAGRFHENAYDEKPLPFNLKKPFALYGNGGADSTFLFRSLLSRAEPRSQIILPVKLNYYPGTATFNLLSATVGDLYMYAYLGKNYWLFKDSMQGKYFTKPIFEDQEGAGDTLRYCYSFATSLENPSREMLERTFRNDLENYFGYEVSLTKRKCRYWSVTVEPSAQERLKTKGGKTSLRVDHGSIVANNVAMKKIMEELDTKRPEGLQYIDDSGLPFNIDLNVEANFLDVQDFFAALAAVGIKITKAEKEMTVLILKKNNARPSLVKQ